MASPFLYVELRVIGADPLGRSGIFLQNKPQLRDKTNRNCVRSLNQDTPFTFRIYNSIFYKPFDAPHKSP